VAWSRCSASSIGCKIPLCLVRCGTVLNGPARIDYGEGQFLAGPERGEKAHVQRQVDICGKVVLRIRYALTSKAMNWIVGGAKSRIVSYPTHKVSTLQAEKCVISPFVEAFSVRKQWNNGVKLATACYGSYEQCAGQRIVRLVATLQ
jgi:hypothetical protein